MAMKHKMIRNPDPEVVDEKLAEFLAAAKLAPDAIKSVAVSESETVGQVTVLIVYEDGSGTP